MFQRIMYRLLATLLVTSTLIGCDAKPTVPSTASTTEFNGAAPRSTQGRNHSSKPNATTATIELTTEQTDFSDKWKAASEEERRTMADLAMVYPLFNGATKAQIKDAFGPATETGIDKFGEDVMRYELGAVPEVDGGGRYDLTFVFENGNVVRIMGNLATISP